MNKRKIADCVSDTIYVVIETKDKNGGIYVQFVPSVWLKPLNPNSKIIVREVANCHYPRRLPGQSIDAYNKFVKNAKFICMEPQNDDKWQLIDCRVLKIDLGRKCVKIDAMSAEKLYSDFFDTTEAEMEMQRTSPTKRTRKIKKPQAKKAQRKAPTDDSDSEQERGISGLNEEISNYNAAFNAETLFPEGTVLQFVDRIQNGSAEAEQETVFEIVQNDNPRQSDGSVTQLIDQIELQNERDDAQQSQSGNVCNCKCMDKLRNKIDYFQKRVMSEMADFRHETSKSISKLTDTVLRALNVQPNQELQERMEISDELAEKYHGIFPADNKITVHEINRKIKTDPDFKVFVELELEKITGTDPTKTARKMLNELCTVNCFSQFTWLGSQKLKKDRFCNLESLIGVLTKSIENRFTNCKAYSLIESVFKQRAKSAGEAVKEKDSNAKVSKHQEDSTSVNKNLDLTAEQQTEGSAISHGIESTSDSYTSPFDPEGFINLENLIPSQVIL